MNDAVSAVFFVIMCLAVTYVMVESSIGAIWRLPMRRLASKYGELFETWMMLFVYCPACTGFWVGFALYWLGWAPWTAGVPRPEMLSGCAGILCGLLLPRITALGTAYEVEVSEKDNESTQKGEDSHE